MWCGDQSTRACRSERHRSRGSLDTGSFSTYSDKALGRWAGFSIGWLYAWFWIIVLGIEATAGAAIMHRWVPRIDQWVWALLLMVLLTLTNLGSVVHRHCGHPAALELGLRGQEPVCRRDRALRNPRGRHHHGHRRADLCAWVALVGIVALLIGMLILDTTRESLLLSLALAAVVGLWRYRPQGEGASGPSGADASARTAPEEARRGA